MITKEIMSDEFTKRHVLGLPFDMVIHHFTGIDKGGPHDHPWGFTSHVLKGSYIERRYFILWDGSWGSEDILRKAGDSFNINAEYIHEIIALPDGECWTLVLPGPAERTSRFWCFKDSGIASRAWHEKEFAPYPSSQYHHTPQLQ